MTAKRTTEDKMYRGVKRVYTLCFLYLMEVIEKYGTDKALELLSKAIAHQSEIVSREISSDLAQWTDPLGLGSNAYQSFMKQLGARISSTTKKGDSVLIEVGLCPIYGAYLDIGLECSFWMRGLCTNIVLPSIEDTLRKFDSAVTLNLAKYRSSAEDSCILEVTQKMDA